MLGEPTVGRLLHRHLEALGVDQGAAGSLALVSPGGCLSDDRELERLAFLRRLRGNVPRVQADAVDQRGRPFRVAEILHIDLQRQVGERSVEGERLVHLQFALRAGHSLECLLLVVTALIGEPQALPDDLHPQAPEPPARFGVARVVPEQVVVSVFPVDDIEDLAEVVAIQHGPAARPLGHFPESVLVVLARLLLLNESVIEHVSQQGQTTARRLGIPSRRSRRQSPDIRHVESDAVLGGLGFQDVHDVVVLLVDRQAGREEHDELASGVDAQGANQIDVLVHPQSAIELGAAFDRFHAASEFLVDLGEDVLHTGAVFEFAREINGERVHESAASGGRPRPQQFVQMLVQLARLGCERRAFERDEHARLDVFVDELLHGPVDVQSIFPPSARSDVNERASAQLVVRGFGMRRLGADRWNLLGRRSLGNQSLDELESRDLLRHTVFGQLEVVLGQARHGLALAVRDAHLHFHERGLGCENRRLLGGG